MGLSPSLSLCCSTNGALIKLVSAVIAESMSLSIDGIIGSRVNGAVVTAVVIERTSGPLVVGTLVSASGRFVIGAFLLDHSTKLNSSFFVATLIALVHNTVLTQVMIISSIRCYYTQ